MPLPLSAHSLTKKKRMRKLRRMRSLKCLSGHHRMNELALSQWIWNKCLFVEYEVRFIITFSVQCSMLY